MTLVPTRMYFKNGHVKIALGLAKGKQDHDKRETIKRREADRETRAAVRANAVTFRPHRARLPPRRASAVDGFGGALVGLERSMVNWTVSNFEGAALYMKGNRAASRGGSIDLIANFADAQKKPASVVVIR